MYFTFLHFLYFTFLIYIFDTVDQLSPIVKQVLVRSGLKH